ncbi:MAG TPA: NAD(P)-dependent oxidoreductase [Candidatus Saccharimonadales bacterium]|nr:NAD(P)-dependent oxidoreductase [Candidatus Saccharimonadales bacterium]
MKLLIIGANGFVGRGVSEAARGQGHEVFETYRQSADIPIDLSHPESIVSVMRSVRPDVVINAAGVLPPGDVRQNPAFSANMIRAIHESGHIPKQIIVSGSAAEYGVVDAANLPVNEDLPAHPTNDYGKSKAEETTIALQLGAEYGLSVVVARIFNPIGPNMQARFLTSRLLAQIDECRRGKRQNIEIGRRDACRDYLDVRDLGAAIVAIAAGNPQYTVYNVGSGRKMSNGELADLLVQYSQISPVPSIIETQDQPEPPAASQADISRLQEDFGWRPEYSLEQTVKDIINDARQ